ncbi:SDR family NAD(P)-dependent oxidoreductase [Chloroflexota bacterium]
MGTKLKGKVALVTGAGRNIGRAVALAIAEEGGDVVLISRTMNGIIEVSKEVSALGAKALPLQADITDAQAIKEVVQKAEAELGKIDILINNAVLRITRPFLEMTIDQWETMLEVNLIGPFNCTQAVLPGMISRRWGRIINFSGISGLWGTAGSSSLATVKAGIIGFSKSLAREFGEYDITVNAVAPGPIGGGLHHTDSINPPSEEESLQSTHRLSRLAIKRRGRPEEVASLVAYLCTESAGYITGDVLYVNGGSYV